MDRWRWRIDRARVRALLAVGLLLSLVLGTPLGRAVPVGATVPPKAGSADVFPPDNVWNRTVTDLPVHPLSATYLSTIGLNRAFHADFGAGEWDGGPIGIPYAIVPGDQPKVPIHYTAYGDQSDPGPMPIPRDAPIEGGPDADGDRHVLVIDEDNGILYELYRAFPNEDGSWDAESGAIWDLKTNATRPDTWTSADAAGLPIFPGLARYDEVASGVIRHALRFTVPQTQKAHIWPARHDASSRTGAQYPPMGLRVRLKAEVDLSRYDPQARVILQALKDYGMILSDNGSAVYISGAPDPRWDNDDLHSMDDITAAMLEVVDTSGLIVDPDTAQARQPGPPPPPGMQSMTVSINGAGGVSQGDGFHPTGATVRLDATPADGWLFASWHVDGKVAGYTPTLNLTMGTNHSVVARFVRAGRFTDVPPDSPAATAIAQLSAAGVIRGYGDGTFGPNDTTLRAQMAALIARAMGWDGESHGNTFTDRGSVDADLWRNVGTLEHYGVARGYGDGTYGPTLPVLYVQTISFISRAMVERGWWEAQPASAGVYPNVPESSGARVDLATYVHYAGPVPGTGSAGERWAAWDQPATRAWFAQALWQALAGVTSAP